MKNILLSLLVTIALTTAVSAQTECPLDEFFCSLSELAKQGDAKAQFNLALKYANGEGVIEDEREAYIWYSIAKANGNKLATNSLRNNNWQKYLTNAEIKSARSEAARRLEAIDQRIKQDKTDYSK